LITERILAFISTLRSCKFRAKRASQ